MLSVLPKFMASVSLVLSKAMENVISVLHKAMTNVSSLLHKVNANVNSQKVISALMQNSRFFITQFRVR